MARKDCQPLIAAPPPADSSSDEDSDDNESSSSSSGDDKSLQSKQPLPTKPHVSDSNSDSDPNPKSKPASLPITHVTALAAVTSKRKTTDSSDKGPVKSAKKEKNEARGSNPGVDEGGKKPMFQRVWSEDDEIVILKGMIEFKAKKGKDPMSDVDGFLGFVKSSLHAVDFKKEQIVSKIRRLKSRFQNPKKRTLTSPHDVNVSELSKSIWGDSYDGNGASLKGCSSKSKSKDARNGVDGVALIDGGKMVDECVSCGIQVVELNKFGDVDEKLMNEGFKLLCEDERMELEEEWHAFNVAQMEGLVKRFELYQKTAKTLLNVVKSAKH